ncbi:MAG TPA: carbohydrate-binding domain-containing protein [Polyangiaceae bacterium]
MKASKRYGLYALGVSVGLLASQSAWAQCPNEEGLSVSGDDLVLKMNGKQSTAQRILVIPVVDSSYAYNPAARQFAGSGLEAQLALIQSQYAEVEAYWQEASYGNVVLEGVIPNCFYQVPSTFPTVGEDAFQRALLITAEASAFGTAYTSVTLKYVSDPAEGEKTLTFTSDGSNVTNPEIVVEQMREQLGAAANEVEIDLTEETISTYKIAFQILESRTFLGSKIWVDRAASDSASRQALGLVEPVMTQPADGQVVITTDGATIPGSTYTGAGNDLSFRFEGPGSFEEIFWKFNGVQPCGSSPPCQTWSNAAQLSSLLVPVTAGTGSISDTTVGGRPESAFTMTVDAGATFTKFGLNEAFTGVDNEPLSETFLRRNGLGAVKRQEGTGSLSVQKFSHLVTADGLESFLQQEFGSPDLGCITPELANAPADFKQAADDYLEQFSAIHVYLLSGADTLRDNASNAVLCADVNVGGTNVTYKVKSPVALAELSSGAATIAHETGHNLGFPDLYDNSNTWYPEIGSDYDPRLIFPGNWDVMAFQSGFPHPGAFTKQFLHGWVSEAGVTDNGTVVTVTPGMDQTFVLTPLERPRSAYDDLLGAVGAPVAKMIVLPFGNTTTANKHVPAHFIAIENRQEGVTFSQELPSFQDGIPGFLRGGVRVTDNIADLNVNGAFSKPINRNYAHDLGTVKAMTTLDAGTKFPSYPGITIENVGMVAGPGPDPANQPPSFMVRVAYQMTDTVDLQIKPWLAPDQYATNAIWFEPATTADPPASPAIPDQASTDPAEVGNKNPPIWLANYTGDIPLNWIHVVVENKGTYNVEQVRVKATFNSPGGAGEAAAWKPIVPMAFSSAKSIPAGGSAVFSIPWNPDEELAEDGHTCVAVEVVEWQVQGGLGQVADINPFNNVSQENIHSMVMKSASPWHDVPFRFEVHNDYDHDLPVELEPVNLRPGYRVDVPVAKATLAARTSRIFEGTFGWDSSVIPTPPNQDPADPYWQACENPDETNVTVYDAEDMFHSGGYGIEGPGWVFYDNGYLSTNHQFGAGVSTITVLAAGQPDGYLWPEMTVFVDGSPIGTVSVDSGYTLDYEFLLEGTAGNKEIRVAFVNDLGSEDRAIYIEDVIVETQAAPAHCGGIWGITAWGLLGDYRVPIGGSSFQAEGKPVGTITTDTTVGSNGDITVSGTVDPPHGGQDVRIYVRHPSGRVDIIDTTTDSGGGYTETFTPRERGPVIITTEMPRGGGPYAPTDPVSTTVEACIPATCSDGVKNQGETGVDCGGPCAACAPPPPPPCTAATAVDLGAPGNNKTVPVGGCVRVQSSYPSWWGTRTMRLETAGGTTYPVPFTWTNTCTGSSGSNTFTANWQSKNLVTTSSGCATVIDLKGTGTGNVTLRYWAG